MAGVEMRGESRRCRVTCCAFRCGAVKVNDRMKGGGTENGESAGETTEK